jgi:hypothetical protein
MTLKGSYKLIYTVDKKDHEISISIELKRVEGMLKPRQNLYYGTVIINGKMSAEILNSCVNAKFCAQSMGEKMKIDAMKKCREEKKLFSIKKEEIK